MFKWKCNYYTFAKIPWSDMEPSPPSPSTNLKSVTITLSLKYLAQGPLNELRFFTCSLLKNKIDWLLYNYSYQMVVIRGCNYSPNHFSLAYPLSSSPHGGIWKTPPQFYQDYQEEAKRHKREREGRDREERERESSDFFRKFFGFFGFFGFESEPETIEPDYPYSSIIFI